MTFTIELLGEDGCPVSEDRWRCYTAERDPFDGRSRVLLQAAHLYRRGGMRERLITLEASQRLCDRFGKPLPHHLPETVTDIVVESGRIGSPGHYFARYRVLPLDWREITLSLPENGGKGDFGDFSGYECQPFAAEAAYSPWQPGWLYVRIAEELPFPDDSEQAQQFALALGRARWKREGLHIVGRNLRPARIVVVGSRIRPQPQKAAVRKGRKR